MFDREFGVRRGRTAGLLRIPLIALTVGVCIAAFGGGTAAADPTDCASSTNLPGGAIAETTFTGLQTDIGALSSTAVATYYLDAAAFGTTYTAGGSLAIPVGANVTLDLDGCQLAITSPAAGDAAIAVPSGSSLTITDTSPSGGGGLTADSQNDTSGSGSAAAIGGDAGADSGSVTITGGTVQATSGSADNAGGGAAIGGGGGAEGAGGGSAGALTVTGGQLTATSGGSGLSDGGSGAGIGGGGGGTGNVGSGTGGAGGVVSVSGGSVIAASGDVYFAGLGAGIGGGGGGAANSDPAGGGAGATVTLTGGVVSASTGDRSELDFSTWDGIGAGGVDPVGSGAAGAAGSVVVPSGTGSTAATLSGEVADPLTVDAGARLNVADGATLTLDNGADTNNGTLQVTGTLAGSGSLDNAGSIVLTGPDATLPGDGQAVNPGDLAVTDHAYELTFVDAHSTPPSPTWVFAPTVSASGQSLPTLTSVTGYRTPSWKAGSAVVTDTSTLSSVAKSGVVALTADYPPNEPTIVGRLSSAHAKTRFGWYRSAVTVKFTCKHPTGATLVGSCASVKLRKNGRHLRVSRTVNASNGGSARWTSPVIKLDSGHAVVKITGPKNGKTYQGRAPKPRCKATERLSGVASCKLTTSKKKITGGYRHKVVATARTKAGVVSTKKLVYDVRS